MWPGGSVLEGIWSRLVGRGGYDLGGVMSEVLVSLPIILFILFLFMEHRVEDLAIVYCNFPDVVES